jgi:hypothetical protein
MQAMKIQPSLIMSNSDPVLLIETVRPDDGRSESFWVALVITGVLLLGGLGILLRQEQTGVADTRPQLDLLQRQFLMELTIAADEIRFIATMNSDISINSGFIAWPLEQLLQEQLLPLFPGQAASAWQQLQPGCLLIQQPNSPVHFALVLQQAGSSIHYSTTSVHHPAPCETLLSWQRMDIQS